MSYKIRPEVDGLSDLAHPITSLKNKGPDRTEDVYGVCVHTTGSTIVDKAYKAKADPLEYAVAYYSRPDTYWAHYVIGHNGAIAQISDEHERAAHVGLDAEWRQAYRDGSWREKLPKKVVSLWVNTWPYDSPDDLYPGPSPNNVYIGVELLPVVYGVTPDGYTAMRPELSFTAMQHEATRALVQDIWRRWKLPPVPTEFGQRLTRCLGHEDLHPANRSDAGGGWDPGALRDKPRFDWNWIMR